MPVAAPSIHARVLTDPAELAGLAGPWDRLADACSRPMAAHAWLGAWWEHAAPDGARLAVVVVEDGAEVVGVAPGFVDRGPLGVARWRPLGTPHVHRVEPLAEPAAAPAVAAAIAAALARHRPRPELLSLEFTPRASRWPELLAAAWPTPGAARTRLLGSAQALVLDTAGGDFDAWFMSRTKHFRQRLRKARRLAGEAGAAFRLATPQSAKRDVESFLRVHGERWDERGGSRALTPGIAAALRAAAPSLVASGRLRLWSLDAGDRTIASSLVFVAGREAAYWLNGFAAGHDELEPAKISILHVIEDAFALGVDRLDLGEGALAYKRRFADAEEPLDRVVVAPARRPLVGLALAPARARSALARRLTPETRTRLRRLAGRRG